MPLQSVEDIWKGANAGTRPVRSYLLCSGEYLLCSVHVGPNGYNNRSVQEMGVYSLSKKLWLFYECPKLFLVFFILQSREHNMKAHLQFRKSTCPQELFQ